LLQKQKASTTDLAVGSYVYRHRKDAYDSVNDVFYVYRHRKDACDSVNDVFYVYRHRKDACDLINDFVFLCVQTFEGCM